jgi:hypothetical protein
MFLKTCLLLFHSKFYDKKYLKCYNSNDTRPFVPKKQYLSLK